MSKRYGKTLALLKEAGLTHEEPGPYDQAARLTTPRVYIYGGPQETKIKLHPVLDRDFLDPDAARDPYFRKYIRSLKYLPCRGEFDLYVEPADGMGCPCGL